MGLQKKNCVNRADGNYNAQGKLGAAVLGNALSRVYQLLLYKGKQQHVTSARISPSFQFVVSTVSAHFVTLGAAVRILVLVSGNLL
jgi:hypothetical protein